MTEKIVYQVIDRSTGEAVGSYSRAYNNEYYFDSVEQARAANVHGLFQDRDRYRVVQYRVTYQEIDADVP